MSILQRTGSQWRARHAAVMVTPVWDVILRGARADTIYILIFFTVVSSDSETILHASHPSSPLDRITAVIWTLTARARREVVGK